MTGGDPPLPPSRTPYSWQGQGRPYRRRGAPPSARAPWTNRRLRSPPPSSARPRYPRPPPPHKHHRHVPQPPPSSQPNYHHHHTPPLSRNLQARLRSPPRSPPIRRSDHPPHRPENHRADQHRPPDRVPERPLDRPADQPPYRGEPGPSHRVDNSDGPPFRPSDRSGDTFPLRGPPPKPRSDLPPYRSEHGIPRPPGDHHIPYRGEPGPLYRADNSSYRDEMDRRGPSDGGSGRGDPYTTWFRNPSKIHKPGRKKIRRYLPHMSGAGRSAQLSKPDSPILSRIGYHPMDRGASRHEMGPAPLLRSGPMAPMGKMGGEGGSRYGGTPPMAYERDGLRRAEKGVRPSNSTGIEGAVSNRSDAENAVQHGKSTAGDAPGAVSGTVEEKGSSGAPTSRNDTRAPAGGAGSRKASTLAHSAKSPAEQGERQNGTRRDLPNNARPDSPRNLKNEQSPTCGKSAASVGRSGLASTPGTSGAVNQRGDAGVPVSGPSEGRGKLPSEGSVNAPKVRPELPAIVTMQSKMNEFSGRKEHLLPDKGNRARGVASGSPRLSGEQNDVRRGPAPKTAGAVPKEAGHEGHTNRTTAPPREKNAHPTPAKRERASNHGLWNGGKERPAAGSLSRGPEKALSSANRELKPPTRGKVRKEQSPLASDNPATLPSPEIESRVVEMPPVPSLTPNKRSRGKITAGKDSTGKESVKPDRPVSSPLVPGSEATRIPFVSKNEGAAVVEARDQAAVGAGSSLFGPKKEPDISKQDKEIKSMGRAEYREDGVGKKPAVGVQALVRLKAKSERTPSAPFLPVLELRSALSSRGGHPTSATLKGRRNASPALSGLRSALNPPSSIQPICGAEPKTPVTPKMEKGSSPNAVQRKDDMRSTPVPRSPVSVPLPALSFLRSSPRVRARTSSVECKGTPQSLLVSPDQMQTVTETPLGNETRDGVAASDEKNKLVNQIHAMDEQIRALGRQLATKKANNHIYSATAGAERGATGKETQVTKKAQKEKCEMMARAIAELDLVDPLEDTRISPDPSFSSFRLLLSRNKSVAAASRALLRPFCVDTETGLTEDRVVDCDMLKSLPEWRRTKVAAEIARRKKKVTEEQRQRWKEYRVLRDAWERKMKLARDKRSKEKREMMKERDRFLVMCTKGQSALLSSRTSSGRMSTKIFPSLNVNGQTNTNAEVDALLASIAAEGGTPGLKEIWSKTLADIPVQDPRNVPSDIGSVWIEDPLQDFQASRAVNPWRFEEKLIFLDKYAMYPKNFRKIAGFLDHKTTLDCSAFYYQHKLDLGLKQLAKEASTMKRKGILKAHIVTLARKRPSHDPDSVVTSVISAFLSSSHGSTVALNHDRAISAGDSPSERKTNGVQKVDNDRRKLATSGMNLKKRIISECGALDLSGITREAFLHALSNHGQNWHLIARAMALPGKSSSHYREFYKRNKRRLRIGDVAGAGLKSGPTKSPATAQRQSPIVSPKISPKSSPIHADGRGGPVAEPEPMMLDARADAYPGSKEAVGTDFPNELGSKPVGSPVPFSPMDVDGKTASSHVQSGHRANAKTATWTAEERERFKQLFKKHKRDWKKIAQLMPPKTPTQVKGYWRKIAHEVGNGFPSDSGKISKSERKRSRRVQPNDGSGIIEGKRHLERKSSPEKSALVAPIEGGKNGIEAGGDEHKPDTGEKYLSRENEMQASVVHKKMRGSREMVTEGNERRGRGIPEARQLNDTVRGIEKVGLGDLASGKVSDGRLASSEKAPTLRSAPMPMLRSIPVAETQGSIPNGTGGSKRVSDEYEKKDDGESRKQDRLRRAAESYGVLELLDGANGDGLDRVTG